MKDGLYSTYSLTRTKCLLITEFHLLASSLLPAATATAKSLQLCLTLCDPIEGSAPGSPVSEIVQARILEWIAISSSNA